MLAAGTLKKPADIFDLFWHARPFVLLSYRVFATRDTRPVEGTRRYRQEKEVTCSARNWLNE